MNALFFQAIKQLGLGFLCGQARNLFKTGCNFGLSALNIFCTTVNLTLQRGNLMLTMIEGFSALIKTLLTLIEMVFAGTNSLHTFLALSFGILLHLEDFVLRFNKSLALEAFRLALSIGKCILSFKSRSVIALLEHLLHQKITNQKANNNRYHGGDYDFNHETPFRSCCVLTRKAKRAT